MFIPDPTFFHPAFRISDPNFFHPGSRIRIKESYFNPKNWFLSSRKYDPGCSSRIPDPDFLPIPDPGSRGSKRHSITDPATLAKNVCCAVGYVGRGVGVQPPTATVPPTLMPARSLPVVSDVSASYPSSVYGTGAYSTGYVQQSLPSTMANTVYSTGYLQTVAPQFYSGGYWYHTLVVPFR